MRPLALLLLLFLPFASVQADAPRTFREAKKIAWTIYAERPVDFYCGCAFEDNRIDLDSCGYIPRKQPKSSGNTSFQPG